MSQSSPVTAETDLHRLQAELAALKKAAHEIIEHCSARGDSLGPDSGWIADRLTEALPDQKECDTPEQGIEETEVGIDALLPCPFCNHMPEDWRDFLHPTGQGWRDDRFGERLTRHYMRRDDPRGVHGMCWELGCLTHEGGCGATVHGDSREEAIAAWNQRSNQESSPITDEMVERAAFAMERARKTHWTDEQFEIWWNRDSFFMDRKTSWAFFSGTEKEKCLWEARIALESQHTNATLTKLLAEEER